VPAFYSRPADIDDMVNHTVGRVLDLFDIDTGTLRRWGEEGTRLSGRSARWSEDEIR